MVNGQAPSEEGMKRVVTMHEENAYMVDIWSKASYKCGNDLQSGDFSTVQSCINLVESFNKHFKTFLNETQKDRQIILGFDLK